MSYGNKSQGDLTVMKKWYVAHSKPRNEELLWKQFSLRNLESYYPCIKVPTVNPRARNMQPYFPGYLFVHVDLEQVGKSILEWIPGGGGLVTFGDEPAFISDSIVYAIKQQLENLKSVSKKNVITLCKGDHVVIRNGVFAGYEGIFDIQLSGTDRVHVLLSSLENNLFRVDMPVSCVH